jgi:hypothetical protein
MVFHFLSCKRLYQNLNNNAKKKTHIYMSKNTGHDIIFYAKIFQEERTIS